MIILVIIVVKTHLFTFAHDNQRKDAQIWIDDTSSNGFPFTFARSAGSVAGMSLGKQQTNTAWKANGIY